MDSARCVFVDDSLAGHQINGYDVIDMPGLLDLRRSSTRVCVAIADPEARRSVVSKCSAQGFGFFPVRAESATEMDEVRVGEGAILSAFVTITSNVRIGRHFQANIYSYVAHDCIIGDFVTFAPRVCCNGNVHIGDGAYLGTGAIIRQGTPDRPMTIGEAAVVGMGAVVTKPVPPGVTVVGNPARALEKRS